MDRLRCSRTTVVTKRLLWVVALIGPVTEDSTFDTAGHCWLEGGHGGDHMTLVLQGSNGRDVWIGWAGNQLPQVIHEFDPCPGLSSGKEDSCGLYRGHPAGHAWEFTDPELEAVRSFIEANPEDFKTLLEAELSGQVVCWPMN